MENSEKGKGGQSTRSCRVHAVHEQRRIERNGTYLHSTIIPMRDAQVEPLAGFHLRTGRARAFLLQRGDERVREVLCEASVGAKVK